jgi:hypothetical protein
MNTITEKRSQEKNDAKEDAPASTKVTLGIVIAERSSFARLRIACEPLTARVSSRSVFLMRERACAIELRIAFPPAHKI